MQKIKFYGLGGQGVVTAARVLVHAVSIHEDKYGKTIPAYGHERRGAPVYSDVMIDARQILLNCFVYEPDIVVVFAESVLDHGIPVWQGIHDNSILLINTSNESLARDFKEKHRFREIFYVDATAAALEEIGKDIPNTAMLGVMARAGMTRLESIESSLNEMFGAANGEKNAAAARKAHERTQHI